MSAHIFARIQLMLLLLSFFVAGAMSRPVEDFNDWSIGQLPTGDHDHISGLYLSAGWNGGEAQLDLSDSSRPPTNWIVDPSPVVSRDAFELPHEDWFATEPSGIHQLAGSSSGQSSRDPNAQRGALRVPGPVPIQTHLQRSGNADQNVPLNIPDQHYPFLSRQSAWQSFLEASNRALGPELVPGFHHIASPPGQHQDSGVQPHQVQLFSNNLPPEWLSQQQIAGLPLGYERSHGGLQVSIPQRSWHTYGSSSLSRPSDEVSELPFREQHHDQEAQRWLGSELDLHPVHRIQPVFESNGDEIPGKLDSLDNTSREPATWQSASHAPARFLHSSLTTMVDNIQGTSDPEPEWESLNDYRRIMRVFDRSQKKREKWEKALRRALDLETLRFSAADMTNMSKDQVFIGRTHDAVHGYYPPLSYGSRWTPPYERATSHFLQNLYPPLRTENFRDIQRGGPGDRIYVYLNSGQKLDFLNDKYFLRKLQFLPIKKELLSWRDLDSLYARHVQQFVLPPQGRSRLPLILIRHDGPKSGLVSYIQKLTGVNKTTHTVSLWSPVLYDGSRYTIVLYGVGQLKQSDIFLVQKHLKRLNLETPHNTYHPSYNLAEIVPHLN
ncbi:uncharacterized protein UTRI_10546_B [Ustilago trichophora]|uniref:Effector family protein Eff1 n=1 Tax=Ustilago trichophora TaxID=86804 RepID=A0A5C3EBQ4_9BASI|nr:uncharacterized protein UTRI_10546_B [Ustilago trichophora]